MVAQQMDVVHKAVLSSFGKAGSQTGSVGLSVPGGKAKPRWVCSPKHYSLASYPSAWLGL